MSKKTYKCQYCNFRGTKDKLIMHYDINHEEMLPQGYSAAHTVFNYINNKTHGTCVVCKRDTEWNEDRRKYNRLCGRKECSDALRKSYQNNMIKVFGTDNLLTSKEQQEKMLRNRKISGKYKFEDGGYHIYTGSYEKKALAFLDKVLHFKSTDILSPGPVFEYEYNGKKLKWITDILIIPYNLVIEVKDGGDNPNNRTMTTYREKQVAKETMITNMGKFNYLRLTNNNFEQLLQILVKLKHQMIDDSEENKKVIIDIHEEVEALEESCDLTFYYASENDFGTTEIKLEKTGKADRNKDLDSIKTVDNFLDYIYEYDKGQIIHKTKKNNISESTSDVKFDRSLAIFNKMYKDRLPYGVSKYNSKHPSYKSIFKKDGTDAGFIDININKHNSTGYIYMIVSPEYQGNGIANTLIEKAIKDSNKLKIDKLAMVCDIDNKILEYIAKKYNFKLDNIGMNYKLYILNIK